MKNVFVLCEGMQDVAIVGRLLHSGGAIPYDKPISAYPMPLGAFFERQFSKRRIGDGFGLKKSFSRDASPSLVATYSVSDKIWFLLDCGGDSRYQEIGSFIKALKSLMAPTEPGKSIDNASVIIINDADELGLDCRVGATNDNLLQTIKLLAPNVARIENGVMYSCGANSVCTWVWHKEDDRKGTLENLYDAHLASRGFSSLVKAKEYIEVNKTSSCKVVTGSPSKFLKAALTIAGQTKNPGDSLAVILRDNEDLNFFVADCAICNRLKKLLFCEGA